MPKGASAKTESEPRLKNWRLVAAVAVVAAAVLIAFLGYSQKDNPAQKCGPYRNDKAVSIGTGKLKSEVVSTQADRAQGLSGRPCIEAGQGMLFVFEKPGKYPFWMKDMKFSIDIVWMDANKRVIGLDTNVSPSTYPDLFVSKEPAQYVLEVQANHSKDLKVELGTPVSF